MPEKKKRGRPRIRTAAYWREYYRQKQREWRAVHLYGCSPDIVAWVLERLNRIARPDGRLRRAENRYKRKTKSRHAVKRNGAGAPSGGRLTACARSLTDGSRCRKRLHRIAYGRHTPAAHGALRIQPVGISGPDSLPTT